MLFSFLLYSVPNLKFIMSFVLNKIRLYYISLGEKNHTILVVSRYVSVMIDFKSAVKQMADIGIWDVIKKKECWL